MICSKTAKKFCKEDISKIENYDKAVSDTTQIYHCHHRDEVRTLPSGMTVIRSRQELMENGRYYNCPANELIFLTSKEHRRLHNKGYKNPFYGKSHTQETRKKMSKSLKGRTFSEEYRKNMSTIMKGNKNPMYGRHLSEESKRKMSESQKARWTKKKGEI